MEKVFHWKGAELLNYSTSIDKEGYCNVSIKELGNLVVHKDYDGNSLRHVIEESLISIVDSTKLNKELETIINSEESTEVFQSFIDELVTAVQDLKMSRGDL